MKRTTEKPTDPFPCFLCLHDGKQYPCLLCVENELSPYADSFRECFFENNTEAK